jgi:hypothetical protein
VSITRTTPSYVTPLVAAVHSSCQALTPTSWLARCSAERNTFRTPLLSPATGSFVPGTVPGLASAPRICLDLPLRLALPPGMVAHPGPCGLADTTTHWTQSSAHLLRRRWDTCMRLPVTPARSSCSGRYTCPGNTLTLLLALICRNAVSATRRCTGMTKVKCLRLSFAGATYAITSVAALPSPLLCRRVLTSERPCLSWHFGRTCTSMCPCRS